MTTKVIEALGLSPELRLSAYTWLYGILDTTAAYPSELPFPSIGLVEGEVVLDWPELTVYVKSDGGADYARKPRVGRRDSVPRGALVNIADAVDKLLAEHANRQDLVAPSLKLDRSSRRASISLPLGWGVAISTRDDDAESVLSMTPLLADDDNRPCKTLIEAIDPKKTIGVPPTMASPTTRSERAARGIGTIIGTIAAHIKNAIDAKFADVFAPRPEPTATTSLKDRFPPQQPAPPGRMRGSIMAPKSRPIDSSGRLAPERLSPEEQAREAKKEIGRMPGSFYGG